MINDIDYIWIEYKTMNADDLYHCFGEKLHHRNLKMILKIDNQLLNDMSHIIDIIFKFGFDGIVIQDNGKKSKINKHLQKKITYLLNGLQVLPREFQDFIVYIQNENSYTNMNYTGNIQSTLNIVDFPGSKFVKKCFDIFILQIIDSYTTF
jgi:hypothetical protein